MRREKAIEIMDDPWNEKVRDLGPDEYDVRLRVDALTGRIYLELNAYPAGTVWRLRTELTYEIDRAVARRDVVLAEIDHRERSA